MSGSSLGPLLETKLHVAGRPRALVARPDLTGRLRRGTGAALTLVSAPAGFGKTTLLAEWLGTLPPDGPSAAWLSLDGRDNDPVLFWTYVVAALRTALGSEFGAGSLALLQSSQAPLDAVLATLLNELASISDDVVVVLDDYQVIDAAAVHDSVAFLLEHLPPRIRLLIASRADPPLPLARMRVDGSLTEIRAADLRFTPEETAAYLHDAAGAALTAGDIAALDERTEGWIAALQLAALSMQGRADVSSFIAEFAGDDRYIVDYLAQEVLERQPDDVRAFLLQTSILERLDGPSCDAVTGRAGGKARLAALERANLFVVPLDDRRQWYRYHHLFADVLQAHLLDEQAGAIPELHRRASDWYDRNGDPTDAVRHALAAGDVERAADLAELAIPDLQRRRQESTIRAWLSALPDDVVRRRPVLNMGFVGALVSGGQFADVDARLRDIERWLEPQPASPPGQPGTEAMTVAMTVVDQAGFRSLPGAIELYRSAQALVEGDLAATMRHARRVLEVLPTDEHLGRASAAGVLGIALWARGDLEAGHDAFAQCVAGLRQAGHIADILGVSIALADIRRAQGRLGEAMGIYEQAVRLVTEQGGAVLRGIADMYVGMSEVHHERDNLVAARQCLLRARELGDHNGLPQNPYRWRVAMARLLEAEGDLAGAADLLDEAERVYVGDFFPNVRPVPACRARLHVARGELGEAIAWVRRRGLSVDDDLSYLCEFEHITLARILLARSRIEHSGQSLSEAALLLDRLLVAAEAGGRTAAVIEILVLGALTLQAGADAEAALVSLQRAVDRAEAEAYVRVFTDEGRPMAELLTSLAKRSRAARGGTHSSVDRLLATLDPTSRARPGRPIDQRLVEPLSERELHVLRLLGSDLAGPEIARELVVSLHTVRTHTKHIYAKLGVNNRRAAVRRGEELQLLAPRAGR